jgi:drug/metabolite transporter (DMT)-like permease
MTQAKAIVAGILTTLLAGASTLATVLTGTATLATVTQGQWLAVIISMLTSGGAVYGVTYAVTNAPAALPAVVEPTQTIGD